MKIRKYRSQDTPEIVQLFYDTVHTINKKDYTSEQLEVWAPKISQENIEHWKTSLTQNRTYVAEINGKIVGFGDISPTGYLARLYVHKDFQGQGIASALVQILEKEAKTLGVSEITTHASITAKPFFERRGYRVIQEQQVTRSGVTLINYSMSKRV